VSSRAAVPPPGGQGKRHITYDVRIWTTRTVKGARGRFYQVRWTVAGKIHYATFATKALADSKEAQLKTAAREGEAFDIAAGLPLTAVSKGRDHEVSWYEFACSYVDLKWEEVAPNSRRAIADALATATPALLTLAGALLSRHSYGRSFTGGHSTPGSVPLTRLRLWPRPRHGPSGTRSRWPSWATPTRCAGSLTSSPGNSTAPRPPRPWSRESAPCCSTCSATPSTRSTSR